VRGRALGTNRYGTPLLDEFGERSVAAPPQHRNNVGRPAVQTAGETDG
jgi:hypothetical protein